MINGGGADAGTNVREGEVDMEEGRGRPAMFSCCNFY